MRFDVVTLFPELFEGPLGTGLIGKAIQAERAAVGFVDPRAFTRDRHRSVDDTPYGGGGGMVMKTEPMGQAIEVALSRGGGPVLLMSPQGRPLAQADLQRWSRLPHLVLVAGRYEGFDERIRELADEEVSLGDFVLTGGEYAALTIIDGVIRLLPGTLGNADSSELDSFSAGLLEYPHYTRPPVYEGRPVPDVLLAGHHAEIAAWRHARSLERTRMRRPDLLAERAFSSSERAILQAAPSARPRIELAVVLGAPAIPASAMGAPAAGIAAELETILATAIAYGVARLHLVVEGLPEDDAIDVDGAGMLRTYASVDALGAALASRPEPPIVVSAVPGPPSATVRPPSAIRAEARAAGRAVLLALGRGTAGLGALLPSVRVASAANDLPLGAAVAVLLDRLVGEG